MCDCESLKASEKDLCRFATSFLGVGALRGMNVS